MNDQEEPKKNLAMGKIKAYVRAGLLIVALLVIAIVLFMNRNNTVSFWFFGITGKDKPVNVVWLIGWTAASTLTARKIVLFARGCWRDLRTIRPKKQHVAVGEQEREQSQGQ